MIWVPLVLFVVGLMLSAFFSGSETGLYRVSRTRLILDGLSGSLAGRGLVYLLNHPSIFVATTLVGNNLANYLTSSATVLFVMVTFAGGPGVELGFTILITPVVFVFGELLPKYLFFQAPYRLLQSTRWLLLSASVLFAPISALLALLGNALHALTGETPFRIQLSMARGDLDQVIREGHEAGILSTIQRSLAKNIFEVGNQSAVSFGVRPERLAIVELNAKLEEARHQARRCNHPIILVRKRGRIAGYYRFVDLIGKTELPAPMEVVRCTTTDRHFRVLLRLYDANSDVAVLYDSSGNLASVVTRRQLLQPLQDRR